MRCSWLALLGWILWGTGADAQGLRGTVRSTTGEPLAYAAVRVRNASVGTVTNGTGRYELPLRPGTYELIFQHLGYQSVSRSVVISNEFLTLDIVLAEQSVSLREVKVRATAEDPAYALMRKAIATAPLHRREVTQYTARVYVKGGGKLVGAKGILSKPGLRDSLKIDSKRPGFFVESVSELQFRQPNDYRNRVIAIQSDLNGQAPPFPYLENSFYNPYLDELLSPLAPSAFSAYRFRYEGSFQDQGVEVNRIRVTPRSPGDDVVEGTLFLVEGTWSLHSLDFQFTRRGIPNRIRQQFAPVQDIWLPVSHDLLATVRLLGLTFEIRYLASVTDYVLTPDPTVRARIGTDLLDEKTELATNGPRKRARPDSLLRRLESGDSLLTLKDLRRVTRQLAQQQRRTAPDRQALRQDSTTVDSAAYRRDSTYWLRERSIPLTSNEAKSLEEFLRTKDERLEKARRDSVQLRRLLLFNTIFAGGTLPLNPKTQVELGSLLLARQFNVAEGSVLSPRFRLLRTLPNDGRLALGVLPRYAFGRSQFSGLVTAFYRRGPLSLSASGGRFVSQFNPENPVPFFLNSRNRARQGNGFLKIYEKNVVTLTAARQFGQAWVLSVGLEAARRFRLPALAAFDSTAEGLPASNDPRNDELRTTVFPNHTALLLAATLRYRPFVRYEIRNGQKYPLQNATPELALHLRRGLPGVLGPDGADFSQVELRLGQYLRTGHRGKLEYLFRVGTFPGTRRLYFPDYQHFTSNALRLLVHPGLADFRLLDLYRLSTAGAYFTAHGRYEFRKLLLTRLPFVRRTGLREGVFANFLHQNRLNQQYTEAGYVLDGLFRVLRLEGVSSFLNGRYLRTDVRFGVALNLGGRFARPFRELDEQIRQ